MTRKLFAIGLCLVAASSCTKKDAPGVSSSSSKSSASKTLVYCSEGSPSGFNPQIFEDGTSINAGNPIYNRLVGFERGAVTIRPDLAERWEISKDGKKYTFYLRKDVKFHATDFFQPTRNMNADDVVFSLGRQLYKDHPYHQVSGGKYVYFKALGMDIIDSIKRWMNMLLSLI